MATSEPSEGVKPTGAGPVVAQPQPQNPSSSNASQSRKSTRKMRWGYGYFAIALALYHFISTFVWIYVLFHFGDTGGWGFLIFLCGVTPSLSIFIWLIVDSTVACCNPPVGDISNICGCDCLPAAKKVMVYPVAVCSGLRVILWIVLIGAAAGHNLSYGEEEDTLNIMLYLLSIAAWDLGPMVLLTVDWWYYYAQKDMNGIFGAHLNPMRCVVGQSVLLMITSWAFLGALLEYADTEDHFEYFWPWIFHGITSTVVLILCVVLNRSGHVKGNKLALPIHRVLTQFFGALMILLVIAVLIWCIEMGLHEGGFGFYMAFYYYTALSVPSVLAMFTFEVQPPQIRSGMEEVPDTEHFPETEMQGSQTTR